MPNRERYQREKMRRQWAREFDCVCGPVPVYLVQSDASQINAALKGGELDARDYGRQSDKSEVFARNKQNHDDAPARLDQFIARWRTELDDDARSCMSVAKKIAIAEKIKAATRKPRTVETIAKAVQKARKRMRSSPTSSVSYKLTR